VQATKQLQAGSGIEVESIWTNKGIVGPDAVATWTDKADVDRQGRLGPTKTALCTIFGQCSVVPSHLSNRLQPVAASLWKTTLSRVGQRIRRTSLR
jgi:hypothetical protein